MASGRRKTINYLSNSELLHEINESKKSFCYFVDDQYADYTIIVHDVSEITDELIERAIQNKVDQLNFKIHRQLILENIPKNDITAHFEKLQKTPADVSKEDLVFRVMSDSHIPEDVREPKKTFLNRIKFPPFRHYAFVGDELREVGRSHWKDGLHNGEFSCNHGKVTDKLVRSLMMMVNRYGTKAKFCRYTYLEDMKAQALLQLSVVMIQFDESKSSNPFAWITSGIHNSFLKILKSEKLQRNVRDSMMNEAVGLSSHTYQMDNEN